MNQHILKALREHVENGTSSRFMCHILEHLWVDAKDGRVDLPLEPEPYREIRKTLETGLNNVLDEDGEPATSVEGWLTTMLNLRWYDLTLAEKARVCDLAVLARLAWIDKLLEQADA